jgi:hypothetical protein
MDARALVTAATLSYTANCALGGSVALRLVDTSGFRWLHHAMFIATAALTGAALVGGAVLPEGEPARRRAGRASAALLAPAAIPLALIPYLGSHGPRHIRVALAAAPFFLSALVRAWSK